MVGRIFSVMPIFLDPLINKFTLQNTSIIVNSSIKGLKKMVTTEKILQTMKFYFSQKSQFSFPFRQWKLRIRILPKLVIGKLSLTSYCDVKLSSWCISLLLAFVWSLNDNPHPQPQPASLITLILHPLFTLSHWDWDKGSLECIFCQEAFDCPEHDLSSFIPPELAKNQVDLQKKI